MWDVSTLTSHRGFSARRIFTHALVAIIAAFLLVLISNTLAHAATNASWDGDNISYNGTDFKKQTSDGKTPAGLKNKQDYYIDVEPTKANIIYFDTSNTTTATSAEYETFDITNGTFGKKTSGPTKITITPQAASASSKNAAWDGQTIEYDGKTFSGTDAQAMVASATNPEKLGNGALYYLSVGGIDATGKALAYVISFPAGSTPNTEKSATYSVYEVNGNSTGAWVSSKTITITPAVDSPGNGGGTQSTSTCTVDGIGWIVCPLSEFLAKGMDTVFNLLSGFLDVQPLSTQTDAPLYKAWAIMRSVANVAFVIAFLIIIYSQITSFGITNYNIKKLLPRLIVAAVLVNLSYYLCAIAVDLSNVLGHSIEDLLSNLRSQIDQSNPHNLGSWESITGFILSSGTAVSAAAAGLAGLTVASGASIGAVAILIIPMLVSLLLALLVALIVLAARQALIIILILLAPIAFVAYLLPNTEKWFTKWRETFTTMLVFFPIFSLVFGGSQLAGFLIRDNATSINVVLLGLFVQAAPLVITPLLIRFSGDVVGRVAGIANNPKKGLLDRTKNWAKVRSDYLADRNRGRQDPLRRRQVFRRFAVGADQLRRAREERTKAYQEQADARWTNTAEYSNIQQQLKRATDMKQLGVDRAGLRYEAQKAITGELQDLDIQLRDVKLRLDNAKLEADVQWDGNHDVNISEQRIRARVLKDAQSAIHSTHDAEFEEFKAGRAGTTPNTGGVLAMLQQSQDDTRLIALNALRSDSAKREVTQNFTRDLEDNVDRVRAGRANGQLMQSYAGGIQGVAGAQRALASAIKARSEAHETAVKNADAILSSRNLINSTITDIALGDAGTTGIVMSAEMREAAIVKIAGGADAGQFARLMRDLEINDSDANQNFRQAFADTAQKNAARPRFLSATDISNFKQGIAEAPGQGRMDYHVVNAVNANKFGSAEVLVNHDRDYLGNLRDSLRDPAVRATMSAGALATIRSSYLDALRNPLYSGKIAERKEVLEEIFSLVN